MQLWRGRRSASGAQQCEVSAIRPFKRLVADFAIPFRYARFDGSARAMMPARV
jgi:hypothetical protein